MSQTGRQRQSRNRRTQCAAGAGLLAPQAAEIVSLESRSSWPGPWMDTIMTASETANFEGLVRKHHRRLMAYALGLGLGTVPAEDLVQDALVVAVRRWHAYDASRDFGVWVRGIIRNKYREWARSRQRDTLSERELEHLDAEHASWDTTGRSSDAPLRALRTCLERLPENLCNAVELFYMKRLSGADTAQRLQLSEANVRKRLERARTRLAKCIQVTLAAEES